MKAFQIALVLAAAAGILWPSESPAAEASLASLYEEWSTQQSEGSGGSSFLSAIAYLEKGIAKVHIGWADLEGEEIWVRPVQLTANGRFRPLQAGVLAWSGGGRTGYQEVEAAAPASPNPRWIEVVLVQGPSELGERQTMRLVLDVAAHRAAAAPARMTANSED